MVRALSLIAMLLIAAPAMAQNPQPTSPTNPTVPVAPPSSASPPPEKIAPSDETMSGRLAQQKGTITPPNVDPGIAVSPPAHSGGTMPVIPPPGSPGSNQSVVPK